MGDRTYSSDKHNPMLKELSPGLYDVKIKAMKLQGASISHTFNKVEVAAGKTTEIAYNFEFGELSILASNNGVAKVNKPQSNMSCTEC